MKKLFNLFFFIFCVMVAKAATFTVTSNADNGTGTLREAISLANANGIDTTDYIYFNVAGSSLIDVTIILETELPKLTSNIIIDATTQPFAALLNPNIKISLIRVATSYFNGLRLDNASDVEIYGFSFSNFKSDPLGAVDDKKAGIFLYNSKNIIIGAPFKPNCFSNNYAGIISPYVIPRLDNANVKISSNIFGLGENGLTAQPNESGIDISFLMNSTIGGDTPEEGNLISANTKNGLALAGSSGTIKIANNIIGLDITLSKTFQASKANGIYVNGENSIPVIIKNTIVAQFKGILLDYVNGGFVISSNKIGTGQLGTENYGNEIGIHVNFCDKGIVGGYNITDGNQIAYNKNGVLVEISYPISILKNSFYCNNAAVTFKSLPDGKVVTQSQITQITANSISGQYLPNSKIELFYTDSCPDCQGKTWFATLPTDANGNWMYSDPVTGKVTSMGTNADGATSTFSKPLIINASVIKIGVVCGGTTGSISVDVFDASVFEWYDSSNVLRGSSRVLTGVGAGTYYLKAGQLGACDVTSASFTIDASSNGINDLQKAINDDHCGKSKGSITNITIANNLTRTWYDANGNVVSTADDLIDVPSGVYYFKAGQGSCEITSANYKIDNVVTVYKAKTINRIPETCGNGNGSIHILAYETERPDRFEWLNEQGDIISTNENLLNQPAGKYTLIGYSNNGCTNTVGDFEIEAAQLPIIDYASFRQFISCDGKTISVIGLVINGNTAPYSYSWQDENGYVVSSMLNISGIQKGVYTLFVKDKYGCLIEGQTIDFNLLISSALEIPNSISPNGDGVNDYWEIKGVQNYPTGDFSIFSRDGNRIFYSRGYAKPFDGFFKGKPLPTGVYYYVIDPKTSCGVQSGSLTILR